MIDGQAQGGGDFRAILNAAHEVDGAADAVLNGGETQGGALVVAGPVIDPADAWAEIPRKVGALLAIAAPELAAVYTDDACNEWGRDMHRVAVKRGWSVDGLPPEVAALISSAALVLPTVAILKIKRDAMRRARAATEPADTVENEGAGGQG